MASPVSGRRAARTGEAPHGACLEHDVGDVRQPRGGHVDTGDLQLAADAGLRCSVQRGEQTHRAVGAQRVHRDRRGRGPGHSLQLAVPRVSIPFAAPRVASNTGPPGTHVTIWPVRSHARDRAENDAWVHLPQLVITNSQPVEVARAHAFDHRVAAEREIEEGSFAVVAAQIEDDTFLATDSIADGLNVGSLSLPTAKATSPTRTGSPEAAADSHLDDLGTQISQVGLPPMPAPTARPRAPSLRLAASTH